MLVPNRVSSLKGHMSSRTKRGIHRQQPPEESNLLDSANARECRWWWASAVYKGEHVDRPRRRNLWERIVFLLRARNQQEAYERAQELARSKEAFYTTAVGDQLRWTLQAVEGVQELFDQALEEGSEVYWEFFERIDPAQKVEQAASPHSKQLKYS